eukprot:8958268-Pyramimonas_sp.AAC.1
MIGGASPKVPEAEYHTRLFTLIPAGAIIIGAPPQVPEAECHMRLPTLISACPSHVSRHHRSSAKVQRLSQHAPSALISAHPSHVSWHHRSYAKGPPHTHFGRPLTRVVTP